MKEVQKQIDTFIREILTDHPTITYEELDNEFRKAGNTLCNKGVLRPSKEISKLHELPLEWEVIKIFQRFVELDSRKAWSKVILSEDKDRYTYDFIVQRGFFKDDYDTIAQLPFIYLVFEVKSHKVGGASIEDLRQLEDWVGRLNRKHQNENFSEDKLHGLLKVPHLSENTEIDLSGKIKLKETPKLMPIFFPYKGVFIINHDWGREDRCMAFGENEISFAVERNFCLISFEDILICKQAAEDYKIDVWFFLEEIWLTKGVLRAKSILSKKSFNKYRRK